MPSRLVRAVSFTLRSNGFEVGVEPSGVGSVISVYDPLDESNVNVHFNAETEADVMTALIESFCTLDQRTEFLGPATVAAA